MSKFLSLCNQIVECGSTTREPLPKGGEHKDKFMEATAILSRAKLCDDELKYGMAVVGNGFDFEVRLQQRARVILALSMSLSNDKLALRSAGLAELVMMFIRGETKGKTAKDMAQIMGVHRDTWYEYKKIYDELCSWCDDLESEANIKIWKIADNENKRKNDN